MPNRDEILKNLPFLRRFSRSLMGTQRSGDAYVAHLLRAAQSDDALLSQMSKSRSGLYAAFCSLHRSGSIESGGSGKFVPLQRQALLLTALEEFSISETAEILGVDVGQVEIFIAEALATIDGENCARVLIIEDEPLISMQLDGLVSDLGHEVCGAAATRTQAVLMAEEQQPTLVLADIQLADGSSGIDAVEDILSFGDVPVIFVTAYPEKLLTGDRPEPAFLITKPFQESAVRAAISQALFFADN